MDATTLEERYLKLSKRLAMVSGVWPYQTKFSKYLARFIMDLVIIASVATQIAKLVYFFNLDVAVDGVPFATASMGIILKQWTYIIKEKEFKLLLDGMYKDWATDRSKEELNIMSTYAKKGVFFTSFYVGNACFCVVGFISLPHVPRILDKIISLNESKRLFIYPAYYAIDEEKYYYAITAHMVCQVMSALFVYAACDTIYMCLVQHACGLIAVSGYRFKYAVEDISIDIRGKNVQSPNEIHRKFCYAVQEHERANLFLREIDNVHFHYLLICMAMIMIAFSITLVKVSLMTINMDFYKYSSFLIVQLMHIFFLSIQGQFLIDLNDEFYNTIYEAAWYNAPVKTQALYLLALRRALSPIEISAGGFITMNLQSFADVIKTSVSYCTVLKSTS